MCGSPSYRPSRLDLNLWNGSDAVRVPSIVQVVLGSDNLPLCKHLYGTLFGFAGAGKRLIHSKHNAQAMGLGPRGGAMALCMAGRQELTQLEFWTRTIPPQRPLPSKWRPSDIGFCRLGLSVPAFPGTPERHADAGHRSGWAAARSSSIGSPATRRSRRDGCSLRAPPKLTRLQRASIDSLLPSPNLAC